MELVTFIFMAKVTALSMQGDTCNQFNGNVSSLQNLQNSMVLHVLLGRGCMMVLQECDS